MEAKFVHKVSDYVIEGTLKNDKLIITLFGKRKLTNVLAYEDFPNKLKKDHATLEDLFLALEQKVDKILKLENKIYILIKKGVG